MIDGQWSPRYPTKKKSVKKSLHLTCNDNTSQHEIVSPGLFSPSCLSNVAEHCQFWPLGNSAREKNKTTVSLQWNRFRRKDEGRNAELARLLTFLYTKHGEPKRYVFLVLVCQLCSWFFFLKIFERGTILLHSTSFFADCFGGFILLLGICYCAVTVKVLRVKKRLWHINKALACQTTRTLGTDYAYLLTTKRGTFLRQASSVMIG